MAAALTVEQLFDTLAIRIDGPKAAEHSIVIDWHFTDGNGHVRLSLSNGALIQTPEPRSKVDADLTLTLTKMQLLGLMAGQGLDEHRAVRRHRGPADAAGPAGHPGPRVRDRDALSTWH